MPSPNRRLRSAVNNRKLDLRRMVQRRLITEGEAAEILQMYWLQKFVRINRMKVSKVDSTAPIHGEK